ncbi:MAG TPA: glycine cleavage T C-terminal barrel domain-containing protein, partial [Acidimicrobiales bacterium]|nr:glycine cleavage T C-terminal barrel domain-containing protein [Acidimicrobiales bacterium]
SFVLQPQGKVDAVVRATRVADDVIVLDVDQGFGEAVLARLRRFRLRMKVELAALPDWACLALRGPEAVAATGEAAGGSAAGAVEEASRALVVPARWPGAPGVDVLGQGVGVPEGVRLCGPEALVTLRVEAGVPAMGAELTERTIPAESGLVDAAVSFTKGCFTGQELVARIDARGGRVPRRLRGVVVAAASLGEGPLPPAGAEVVNGDKVVGQTTTVALSPGLDAAVALAYVRREVEPPATLALRWGDEGASEVPAEVRTLPLVGAD